MDLWPAIAVTAIATVAIYLSGFLVGLFWNGTRSQPPISVRATDVHVYVDTHSIVASLDRIAKALDHPTSNTMRQHAQRHAMKTSHILNAALNADPKLDQD